MTDARRRVWSDRVDRGLGPTVSREQERAAHDLLDKVANQPANWIDGTTPPTDTEEEAQREFLNRLGEISDAGRYPG